MKFFLALCLAGALLAASEAPARDRGQNPKRAAKRAFAHSNAGHDRRNAKARFRRPNEPLTVNAHPRDPERFEKVKAGKPYKYPNPR